MVFVCKLSLTVAIFRMYVYMILVKLPLMCADSVLFFITGAVADVVRTLVFRAGVGVFPVDGCDGSILQVLMQVRQFS